MSAYRSGLRVFAGTAVVTDRLSGRVHFLLQPESGSEIVACSTSRCRPYAVAMILVDLVKDSDEPCDPSDDAEKHLNDHAGRQPYE